ncbi:MAG: resolvase [Hyphomicrobiales bacterium]|nr:MAG: resolvase [Hyphomicrobiales bacterium]
MKFVGYLRVSTARQGLSGLGLQAQECAIQQHVAGRNGSLIETFKEVESGRDNSRPQLARALELARLTGGTLVIAKLDRLSRNAAFLLALQDSGAKFVATDMPDANELTVGIMALVAQQERQATSQRTREALQAAKARGAKLGNPNGAAALRRAAKGNEAALRATQESASARAEALRHTIEALRASGRRSLGDIADELNVRGILTARNARWHRSSVANLLRRLDVT